VRKAVISFVGIQSGSHSFGQKTSKAQIN